MKTLEFRSPSSSSKRRVLVATSQTWPSTGAVPALLAQAGAEVTTFSPGPLGLTGFASERLRASRDPQIAARALCELMTTRRFDHVVIADEMLLGATLERSNAARYARMLPVDPRDSAAVSLTLSKHAFTERAPGLGITIPDSFVASSAYDARHVAQRLGYPVVVRGARGFGGSEVRSCADEREVAAACRRLLVRGSQVVVQRYIGGFRVSACVLFDRGVVTAWNAYRAECSYPDDHSASTVHEPFDHAAILPAARALGAATGFHGMAGLDFMCDGRTLYALELNPRPTIGFAGTKTNRAHFAPALARLIRGETPRPARPATGPPATQCYFPGYAIYFAGTAAKRDSRAWRRLAVSLTEARPRDAALAAWEFARFLYDELGRTAPGLHAAVRRLRAADATPPAAAAEPDSRRRIAR